MITWTWDSNAPGADSCGGSGPVDAAKAAAEAWMPEHQATAPNGA